MSIKGIDKRTNENKERINRMFEEMVETNQFAWIIINGEKSNYVVSSRGVVYNSNSNKIFKYMKPVINKTGHLEVPIKINKKHVNKFIHILVAEAFIPIPSKYIKAGLTRDDLEVHHKDGDPFNNDIDNLEWVTPDEHKSLTKELGQYKQKEGSSNPASTYTDEQIEKVLKHLSDNKLDLDTISKITGVSKSNIQHIRFRKDSWSYLKEKYKDIYNIDNYTVNRKPYYSNKDKMNFINTRIEFPDMSLKDIAEICQLPYSVVKHWNRAYKDQTEVSKYLVKK